MVQTCRKGVSLKILVVCSGNHRTIASFISEQVESLSKNGIECNYFTIKGRSFLGYLKNLSAFHQTIKQFNPDLIHAHYGLSGFFANLQRKIPVITTYHGSDIHNAFARFFSKMSIALSAYNVFVTTSLRLKSGTQSKSEVLPCGVDLKLFEPKDKNHSRAKFGYSATEKLVLFSGAFTNLVKNSTLALEVLNQIPGAKLVELKNYRREEVSALMSAVDCCLMTSFTEGSPQFIKEAMACNCPIVSVNVGDVAERLNAVGNSYVVSYDLDEIVQKLKIIICSGMRSSGRDKILQDKLSLEFVADRLIQIYKMLLNDE